MALGVSGKARLLGWEIRPKQDDMLATSVLFLLRCYSKCFSLRKELGKTDSDFSESSGNIDPRHSPGPVTPLEEIPAAWGLTVQDESRHTDNTPAQPLEDALTALVSATQDETCYTDNTAAKPPLAGHVVCPWDLWLRHTRSGKSPLAPHPEKLGENVVPCHLCQPHKLLPGTQTPAAKSTLLCVLEKPFI